MIRLSHRGDYHKTYKYLQNTNRINYRPLLDRYGALGVRNLASNTPQDTGESALSWRYEVKITRKGFQIFWMNDNQTADGVPIVILLQYGHGTKNGGYVQGRDFINPQIQPIFDQLTEDLMKEVSKL